MSNAYETGHQKIIPAVLLYAFYQGKVLMLNLKSKNGVCDKWNGLGGKLELGESFLMATVREFQEECRCKTTPDQWKWLGELHFPNFKSEKKEDWWVTVFFTELTDFQAASLPLNDPTLPEGTIHFKTPEEILNLNLWEGDIKFLPLVFKKIPFHGTFFYDAGKCVRYELAPIKLASQ